LFTGRYGHAGRGPSNILQASNSDIIAVMMSLSLNVGPPIFLAFLLVYDNDIALKPISTNSVALVSNTVIRKLIPAGILAKRITFLGGNGFVDHEQGCNCLIPCWRIRLMLHFWYLVLSRGADAAKLVGIYHDAFQSSRKTSLS